MNLGENIKQLRIKADLTQNELAERLYVSRELVSKWEQGLRRPDEQSAEKLALIFCVSADEFIEKNYEILEELQSCFSCDEENESEILNNFLSKISKRDRCIFVRRYYYFDGIEEISSQCGLSVSYVRTVLSRTRKKLKKYSGR